MTGESLKKGNDDKKFNHFVDDQRRALHARGESMTDLLTNLFDVYRSVPDEEFKKYIVLKESEYEESKINLTAIELMSLALTKYNTLQQKGEWKQPTAEQEEIVALRAELANLRSKKGHNKKKQQTQQTAPPERPATQTTNQQANGKDKKKGKAKKKEPAWMTQNPDNKTKMTKGNSEYIWCSFHKKWGNHTTEDCKAKKKAEEDTTVQPAISLSATAAGAVFGDDESTVSN